jgi:hypothetical protein
LTGVIFAATGERIPALPIGKRLEIIKSAPCSAEAYWPRTQNECGGRRVRPHFSFVEQDHPHSR